jgi:hypothetical protein
MSTRIHYNMIYYDPQRVLAPYDGATWRYAGKMIKIEWLAQEVWPRQHAVPVDTKRYGDYSLCGRGGGGTWKKPPRGLPRCRKCLQLSRKLEDRDKKKAEGTIKPGRWDYVSE